MFSRATGTAVPFSSFCIARVDERMNDCGVEGETSTVEGDIWWPDGFAVTLEGDKWTVDGDSKSPCPIVVEFFIW